MSFAKALMIAAIVPTLFMSACASQPSSLGAADVSPVLYNKYDCEQIGMESARVSNRVNALYTDLKKKADNDAWQMGVGMILLWPTLFFLEGGDGPEATEYRQLKGEYNALEQASVAKKCPLQFRDIDADMKQKFEADKAASAKRKAM